MSNRQNYGWLILLLLLFVFVECPKAAKRSASKTGWGRILLIASGTIFAVLVGYELLAH